MLEFVRKLIHLSGLLYIPAYSFLGRDLLLLCLALILSIVFPLEYLRLKRGFLQELFRSYEKGRPAGYALYAVAIFLVTLFFSEKACYAAVICSNLGDVVAAIFRKFGIAKVAMFVASALASAAMNLGFSAILAALASSMVEGGRIDDNLSIPIVAATVYEASYLLVTT
ncbi:MAG: hypothetical protein ABWW66_02145 [Archaeoglobaceae archaeon]